MADLFDPLDLAPPVAAAPPGPRLVTARLLLRLFDRRAALETLGAG